MHFKAALVSSQNGEKQLVTGFGISAVDISHTLEHHPFGVPRGHVSRLISGS